MPNDEPKVATPQQQLFFRALGLISDRNKLAQRLDPTYDGDREMFKKLGYPETLTFNDYLGKFKRCAVGKRVVCTYPDSTWEESPDVREDRETRNGEVSEETEFDKQWKELNDQLSVFNKLHRVDTIAGIGNYGVLLIGYDDGKPLEEPVERASNAIYLQPYTEPHAEIDELEDDETNPRFGKPKFYKITLTKSGKTVRVHWSRILHVAENPLEQDYLGTPRMECVFNDICDIQKVTGGAAEMYWRGAYPGLSFNAAPDADITPMDAEDFKDQIEKYVHGLERYMRLQGIDVQELKPQVADPSKHYEVSLSQVASGTGIPQRILRGSERGELASSQDETNLNKRVASRRTNFAEPKILKPLIQDWQRLGVLPDVPFTVEWPDLFSLDEETQADIAVKRTDALAKYVTSGSSEVMPPEVFLEDILGVKRERIQEFVDKIRELGEMEDEEFENILAETEEEEVNA